MTSGTHSSGMCGTPKPVVFCGLPASKQKETTAGTTAATPWRNLLARTILGPEAARGVLLHKLRRIAEDRKAAELIVRIALSVSHSDGGFSASKRARFAEICAVLGYVPECFLGERHPGE